MLSNKWQPISEGRCRIFYDPKGVIWGAVCAHTYVKPWNDVRHNVKTQVCDSVEKTVIMAVYKDLSNG